ncbi:hypothetical protein [Aurantibacillus circumpalustris]|uniref:hypothetical protein n=1 Tax=Aurantibacillus circumpalustris TaxID=3036359 RepID=UPI00295BDD4F|nr:hypothetical protein [Aurantibacillus circumpalustris]
MKKIVLVGLLLSLSVAFFSCKKNQLGGSHTIKGKVAHHSKAIANASVFIKFDAKNFPGDDTTTYDDKVRADAEGNFSIKCYKGDYFLYGFGYDYDILPPYIVVGGTPVHVGSESTIEVNVAVTED